MQTARTPLEQGLARLALPLDLTESLLAYAEAMLHWNRAFNLTAITNPEAVVSHHLLDSLSISAHLHGDRILDVGTGAGLPGIPLAIANPDKRFTLLDSNNKRIRFLRQVCGQLKLTNVSPIHSRIEDCPEQNFSSITSRAFTALPDFIRLTAPFLAADGKLLAMKGKPDQNEINNLPNGWQIADTIQLEVPQLEANRCLVICSAMRN